MFFIHNQHLLITDALFLEDFINVVLETVDVHVSKHLGVNIGCCLTWSKYVEILAKKISKKLGVLKHLKQ